MPTKQTTGQVTAYNPGGRDVLVTRNVPPKQVRVNDNNVVAYAGKLHGPGDEFVMYEGPEADQFAALGHVTVTNHDASEEWNTTHATVVRARLVEHAKAHLLGSELEDFEGLLPPEKWEPADSHAEPVDVTASRVELAKQVAREDRAVEESDFS